MCLVLVVGPVKTSERLNIILQTSLYLLLFLYSFVTMALIQTAEHFVPLSSM